MSQSLGFLVVFGLPFGLLAAACAFVIAFGEYQHHFPDKLRPIGMALQTAFFTLLFFVIASLLLPWLLSSLNVAH